MASIGTTAVSVGSGGSLVQNLGPDALYLGESTVTTSNGVRVESGESIALGSGLSFYAVSAGTSDTRILGRATGIFPAVAP